MRSRHCLESTVGQQDIPTDQVWTLSCAAPNLRKENGLFIHCAGLQALMHCHLMCNAFCFSSLLFDVIASCRLSAVGQMWVAAGSIQGGMLWWQSAVFIMCISLGPVHSVYLHSEGRERPQSYSRKKPCANGGRYVGWVEGLLFIGKSVFLPVILMRVE